jgi:hypothetical protein
VTEPVLGIAGVVLLGLAIVALFLRPRRSKGRMVDAGLAAGAGLLGLAIGLVVADRVHRPADVLAASTQPPPSPSKPASPSTGYVESRLSLQFPIDDEYPTGAGEANVADWYAFRNSISYTPPADEKAGKQSDQMLKLLTDVSWSWLIVVAFDRPTQYSRLDVTFTGGELPYYQIARQNPHYAIIHVQGRIPAGQMDIVTSE